MAALTAERSVSRKGAASTATVPVLTLGVKTLTTIYKGSLVVLEAASGFAIPGNNAAATHIAVGIALKTVVNAGASGSVTVDVQRGLFPFANKGGDLVVQADAGKKVYIEDDQTVAKTAGTLSTAGVFWGFDEAGLPLVEIGIRSATGL
jgi:predicted RecA/RadA family phage recombinase